MLAARPRPLRSRGEIFACLFLGLAVGCCLLASQAEGALRVGLVANTQGHPSNPGPEQDIAAQAQVTWLREEFDWNEIEPSRGAFDWSRYDRVIEAAARRGLRVLPLLNGSADWAGAGSHVFPTDYGDYARYLSRVVARYGPGGQFWAHRPRLASYAPTHFELWNEPYIESFSTDGVDPARYALLVKTAVTAARQANPRAKFVLSADTAAVEDLAPSWIDTMYAAVPDLNLYFDAVAVHPYSSEIPPWVFTATDNRWQFRRMELMRQRFAAHGDYSPFWITELGWATCTDNVDCVSEAQQAQNLRYVFAYAFSQPWIEALFVYHLRDWGPDDQSNREYWFGLLRKGDGSRKPAWAVVREAGLLAKALANPRPPPPAAGPAPKAGLIRLVRPKHGRVPVTKRRLRLRFRCRAQSCAPRRFALRVRKVRRVLTVARFDKAGSRRRKVRLSRRTARRVRRAGRRGLRVKVRGAGARRVTRLRLVARERGGRRG